MRFLTTVIWNLETWKRQKIKNSIFDSLLIVNNFFSQTDFFFFFFLRGACQTLLKLCIFNNPNVWFLWSLKILVIKKWFPFILAKILKGPVILWWVDQKSSNFYHIFLLIAAFKKLCAEFTNVSCAC